jgi:hypothetical protein
MSFIKNAIIEKSRDAHQREGVLGWLAEEQEVRCKRAEEPESFPDQSELGASRTGSSSTDPISYRERERQKLGVVKCRDG